MTLYAVIHIQHHLRQNNREADLRFVLLWHCRRQGLQSNDNLEAAKGQDTKSEASLYALHGIYCSLSMSLLQQK